MNTGQHYYDQMPLYYRRKYKAECKRQGYNFRNTMLCECYGFHSLIGFNWFHSKDGMQFWHMVAQQRFDELDLNRPFARWFRSSTAVDFINKNAVSLTTVFFLLAIASLSIAFAVADRSNSEKKMLIDELNRRDSVNIINRANHIVDSSNIINQTFLPPGWDATLSKEEKYERMMDTTILIPGK